MVTFIEVATQWFNYKKRIIKPSSLSTYYNLVYKNLIPFFGLQTNIKNEDIQRLVIFCSEKGLSAGSVHDIIVVLDSILKFGEQKEICTYFKFDIEYPTILKSRTKKRKSLSIVEIRKLRGFVMANCENNLCYLAICIGLSSGLRIGEVTGLRFADFDHENKMVAISRTSQRIVVLDADNKAIGTCMSIGSTKTKCSNRKVPIPEELLTVIKKMQSTRCPEDYVFLSKYRKTPIDNRLIRENLDRLTTQLDLPKVNFHSLRHSFASNCIASDIDVKTTSSLLGHSDIKMTLDIYTHPSIEQKRAAINKLSKLFSY